MCPLQIINDIEPLSLTLHGLNACFIYHPSNVENYSISHRSETNEPKQKKFLENIFSHLYTGFGVKIQNTNGQKSCLTFLTSVKLALYSPANDSEVTYSKMNHKSIPDRYWLLNVYAYHCHFFCNLNFVSDD